MTGESVVSPQESLYVLEKDEHMSTRLRWLLAGAAFMVYGLGQPGVPTWAQGNPQEEAALRTRAEAFVAAFAQGDAKALAAFWTPDGDYMDQTGRHLKGREAIEHAYQQFFSKHQGVTLGITMTSIRVMTPDLAIEDGTTDVRPVDGGPPRRARYVVIHLKQDGQWCLASVRETVIGHTRSNGLIVPGAVDDAVFSPPAHDEHLRELEWLIGDWGDAGDTAAEAQVSFTWAAHQNFIVASLTTMRKDLPVGSASQWIGWDPVAH
jgi:uncharacterized protein (TIGR02246 family)